MVCVGYLVQDSCSPWNRLLDDFEGIAYGGICAYWDYPLRQFPNDKHCSTLTNKQAWEKDNEGFYYERHFISNRDLLEEYLSECRRKGVKYRLLRIESSDYSKEVCSSSYEIGRFLGYEVCPLPFDDQILSDYRYNPLCTKEISKMNHTGLYESLIDAQRFRERYTYLLEQGLVGDGEADIYVFAVYEIQCDDLLQ